LINTSIKADCFIIQINESIYPDNCEEIISCFNEAFKNQLPIVVLDLTEVEVIYSSGITSLVQFFTQLKSNNRELILVGIQEGVLKVFKLLGLHQLFRFAETLENALATRS
jgi:anti-anti-sigma factor